jgi:small subunit ribosomal protein S15
MSDRKNAKKVEKQAVIKKFSPDSKNSGSVEVQVAVMTKQIADLTEHLKVHKKDFSSRKGLLILVGKRRSLLDYLKAKSAERYEALIKTLELRK